jgi:DNA-3-methyladenine glycosylase
MGECPLPFSRSSRIGRLSRLAFFPSDSGCDSSPCRYRHPVQKLPRSFYDRDTVEVARDLLGKHLAHRTGDTERIGRIVEVEAYLGPHDLAAHSSKGLTERTKIMFGPPGHAYVFFIYGMYYCMNVVTESEGHASAVLLRALEPVQNVEGRTQGPGLLCRAMQIDKRLNGHDLLSDDFYIALPPKAEPIVMIKRPRIGVDYARHWAKRQLRFYISGNPFISRP